MFEVSNIVECTSRPRIDSPKCAGGCMVPGRKCWRCLAPHKQTRRKPRRRRGRSFFSGNTLQDRPATVQREKYVSDPHIKPATIRWPACNRRNGKVKYIRQSASLTAFGNPIFDNLFANIALIHTIFRRAIGHQLIGDTAQSSYTEYPGTIDVANRYFVPKANALPADIRTLTTDVDPFGTLLRAAGSAYVHTEENKVYYYEKTCGADGGTM